MPIRHGDSAFRAGHGVMALADKFVSAGTDRPSSQQNSCGLRKWQENLDDRTTFVTFDQPVHLEACDIGVLVRIVAPGGLGKGLGAAGPDAVKPVQHVHASQCL